MKRKELPPHMQRLADAVRQRTWEDAYDLVNQSLDQGTGDAGYGGDVYNLLEEIRRRIRWRRN